MSHPLPRSLDLLLLAIALFALGCAGALPTSLEGLKARALAAIRYKRPAEFFKLMAVKEALKKACPESWHKLLKWGKKPVKFRGKSVTFRQHVRSWLYRCHRMVDWEKLELIREKGGERLRPIKSCGNRVFKLKDIYYRYRIGSRRFRVKLDDPIFIDGQFGLLDNPSCHNWCPFNRCGNRWRKRRRR